MAGSFLWYFAANYTGGTDFIMGKMLIGSLLALAVACAASTQAADQLQPPQRPNFEQVKAEVARRITARITRNQEELSCVQTAKNHQDLKACMVKFRKEMQEQKGQVHRPVQQGGGFPPPPQQ